MERGAIVAVGVLRTVRARAMEERGAATGAVGATAAMMEAAKEVAAVMIATGPAMGAVTVATTGAAMVAMTAMTVRPCGLPRQFLHHRLHAIPRRHHEHP